MTVNYSFACLCSSVNFKARLSLFVNFSFFLGRLPLSVYFNFVYLSQPVKSSISECSQRQKRSRLTKGIHVSDGKAYFSFFCHLVDKQDPILRERLSSSLYSFHQGKENGKFSMLFTVNYLIACSSKQIDCNSKIMFIEIASYFSLPAISDSKKIITE